jgi:regulator of RNase E activity RraA
MDISAKTKQHLLDLSKRFKDLYVASVSDVLDQMEFTNSIVDKDIKPMFQENSFMCGPAATIRGSGVSLKNIELESVEQNSDEKNPMIITFFEKLESGQVTVFGTDIWEHASVIGDVLSCAFKAKGAEGALVDGYIRDYDRIEEIAWPVFARGYHPRSGKNRIAYLDLNCTLQIGGVLVRPWDIVFGDRDGIVVIPKEKADEIYERAEAICRKETKVIKDFNSANNIQQLKEDFLRYLTN